MSSLRAPLSKSSEILELSRTLSKRDRFAFDTEFIRENTFFPIVEILQIATEDEAWIVDLKAFPGERSKELQPLWDLFRDPKILKIAHAIQGDQECLQTSFGVLASPTFDTATGAALLGLGENIGLGNLLRETMGIEIEKGHSRTNWSVRPLPEQLISYALQDVEHLVKCSQLLEEQLRQKVRFDWALELSSKWSDPKLYESDPIGLSQKLAKSVRMDAKSFGVLVNLVTWREKRVRELNIPRKWLADDQVLVDLAKVKPKDLSHLSTFRGLNRGELKSQGAVILDAIREGRENPIPVPKATGAGQNPTPEENLVLDLLKAYLAIIAHREKVSLKVLFTVPQLLPLLRAKFETEEDLVNLGILTPEVHRLIGRDLVLFLKGRQSLSLAQGKIVIQDIAQS